ncbi:MAG: glycosyltransferase family 2 protein [Candidatus Omnitrophota bacterium]|jgi:glycosyltransferase involved in cell wall biosynthesis|nr:MAG: glycosyltransferase family 2 protein [Candidatus Omnitrophota bacterium]
MKLSIIIPAYNEEANIADVISKLEQAMLPEHELVVVNDHSTDNTHALVNRLATSYPNLVLVNNEKERGFANAIMCGIGNAKGDVLLPVMADLCDELQTVNKMYDKIIQGYDVVCGSRYIKGGLRQGGPKFKAMLSRLGGFTVHLLIGVPTHDIANAFKMYRKEAIKGITIYSKGFEVSMELALRAYFNGFKVTEVPTKWKEREKGKSSFKVFRLLPNYIRIYLWALKERMK